MSNNTEWSNSFWNGVVVEHNAQEKESQDENLTQREVLSQMIGHILVDAGILEDFEPLYLERNDCIMDGYFFEEEGEGNTFLTLHVMHIVGFNGQAPNLSEEPTKSQVEKSRNQVVELLENLLENSLDCDPSEYRMTEFKTKLKDLCDRVSMFKVHTCFYGGSSSSIFHKSVSSHQTESHLNVNFRLLDFTDLSLIENIEEEDSGIDVSIGDFDEVDNFNSIAVKSFSEDGEANVCNVYLSVMPGEILADAYEKSGKRLMKSNVRAFLQLNKINAGIKRTIVDEPEKFFVYNNGISATASKIEGTAGVGNQFEISALKGFQVVNGGQTVASLHRAKYIDGKDLSEVWVQAKITEVSEDLPEHDAATLVSNIARYSNSQNAVIDSDFSSNAPVHIKLASLSKQIISPRTGAYWFYERYRKQYETEQSRNPQSFIRTFPSKVDKLNLAQCHFAYLGKPHILNLGAQKYYKLYMRDEWPEGPNEDTQGKVDAIVNEKFYRDMIAKIIVYRSASKMAGKRDLDLTNNGGYKSQAEAFTVALFWRRYKNVDGLLDEIWSSQEAGEQVEMVLREWMPKIMTALINSAAQVQRNVTEWANKEDCWEDIKVVGDKLQSPSLQLQERFAQSRGIDASEMTSEYEQQLVQISTLFEERKAEFFGQMVAWAKDNEGSVVGSAGTLVEKMHWQVSGTVLGNCLLKDKMPSDRQARWVSGLINLYQEADH